MVVVVRYDSGYRKPKVTFRETAKQPRMFAGRFTLADHDAKQADLQAAAQPAKDIMAVIDANIARHDAEKEQARLDEQRREEKRIARDKAREEQNAQVEEECRQAKAAKIARQQKAEQDAALNQTIAEIHESLENCNATDEEISAVRQMLKANDDLLSKTAWVAGLLKLRTNDEGRMK
jgi:hypothetical protein